MTLSSETIRAAEWTEKLLGWVQEAATSEGFDASGVADAGADPGEVEHFAAWVDAGRAGEMGYLKRRDEYGSLLRGSVQTALPWARSVLVCALNYNAEAPRSMDAAGVGEGWIARYAWSGQDGKATDYHQELLGRLRRIEAGLQERAECETRCYVDTGPIVERGLAAKAGVGWIGKNTCVLSQSLGSWLLLGVIVTSLPLPEVGRAEVAADRCGSCTRCLEACPTGALVAPREMDASLCIAYLTIEKKGSIAEELRGPMGRQVFGCDICQDVCPWNSKAPIGRARGMETRRELVNPALEWLAGMDSAEFRRTFKGSPLERTGRKRLQRNVALAMGNSGETRFGARLEEWAAGEDAALAEAAEWGLRKLKKQAALLASDESIAADPTGV